MIEKKADEVVRGKSRSKALAAETNRALEQTLDIVSYSSDNYEFKPVLGLEILPSDGSEP